MSFDLLNVSFPDVALLAVPDADSYLPRKINGVHSDYDQDSDFGNKEEDFWISLWSFCVVLKSATSSSFFQIHSEHRNNLIRYTEDLFAAMENSGMLEPNNTVISDDEDLTFPISERYALKYLNIRKIVRFVIESLCYFGEYKWIYDFIKNYHNRFSDKKDKNKLVFRLDFADLYLQIGDICLYHYNNYYGAQEFYELAALDWYLENSVSFSPTYNIPSEKECLFLTQLAVETNEYWFGRRPESRRSYLSKDLSAVGVYTSWNENYWLIINTVATARDEGAYISYEGTSDRKLCEIYEYCKRSASKEGAWSRAAIELRLATGALLIVRHEWIIKYLIQLSKESSKKQVQYCERVLSCFFQNEFNDETLSIFQEYVLENIPSCSKWTISRELNNMASRKVLRTLINLAVFSVNVDEILDKLEVTVNKNNRFAYYTTYDRFGHMFWREPEKEKYYGRIPLFHVAYMNDPNEGRILPEYLMGMPQEADKRKDMREPYVYIKCFTGQTDDLPMWEMYGDGAKGICVVLDGSYYPVSTQGDESQSNPASLLHNEMMPLYHVLYMHKTSGKEKYSLRKNDNTALKGEQINDITRLLTKMKSILQDDFKNKDWYIKCLRELRYLFKDADYYHEKETRLIKTSVPGAFELTKGEPPMLFRYMDGYPVIDEIIIGPKFEDRAKRAMYLQASVDKFYSQPHIGIKSPSITFSTIDYR